MANGFFLLGDDAVGQPPLALLRGKLGAGVGDLRLLLVHILPNIGSLVIIQATVSLVEAILNSPRVADVHKEQLQKMIVRKGELSFYDIFTLARAESTS